MMNVIFQPNSAVIMVLALLTGCCHKIVAAPHAMRCDVDEVLLKRQCRAPSPIGNGITFSDVIEIANVDRKALNECALSYNTLRDSINRCNQAIDSLNKKIDETNESNKVESK